MFASFARGSWSFEKYWFLILLICRPGKQEGISKPVFNQGGALQVSFNVFQIASISFALLSKIICYLIIVVTLMNICDSDCTARCSNHSH